jgi:hypothetical protein
MLRSADVSIELAAVAVFKEIMVSDMNDVEEFVEGEVNELLDKKLDMTVDNALVLLLEKKLPVLVGTTEVSIMLVDPFEDMDEVLVRKTDVEFILVKRDEDTVASDATIELVAVGLKEV